MSDSSAAMESIGRDIIASILDAVASPANQSSKDPSDEVKSRVLQEATRVAQDNAGRIVDTPSQRWVMLCSLLLAAYRTLKAVTGDGAAAIAVLMEATRQPFTRHIAAYLDDRFGISPDAPEEAFDRISGTFKARGEERFGVTFTYVLEVQEQDRSHINVTKCFFNDFFAANGAPEVTPVLCTMDAVWAEETEHPRYGVHFERPTTLAAGGDACRFQFSRLLRHGGAT